MIKNKQKRWIQITFAFIAALFLLIYGINFMKGIDIFSSTSIYHIKYENLDGLVVSNNVNIDGYKVGQVKRIDYDFSNEMPFTVTIQINNDIRIPKDSKATLYDDGIMGGKAIQLDLGQNKTLYALRDTLRADVEPSVSDELEKVIGHLTHTFEEIDSTLNSINQLARSKELQATLENMNGMSHQLKLSSIQLNQMMHDEIPSLLGNLNQLSVHLDTTAQKINAIPMQEMVEYATASLKQLDMFTQKLNNPNSSLSLLMKDPSLYHSLDSTLNNTNKLIIDLKENPKRYVHFSLWGGKKTK